MKVLFFSLIGVAGIVSYVSALPYAKRAIDSDPRAKAVKSAFRHAWKGYSAYAFGHDELLSNSNHYSDSRNGWGASIVDGLDTMIIMELEDEYQQALSFIENLNWNFSSTPSKTFETCIRYLGGLLSAYDLRPNPIFLDKAISLVEKVLLPAFKTPTGVPSSYFDVTKQQRMESKSIVLAEFALQLEFVRLAQVTGEPAFERLGNSIIEKIAQTSTPIPGLYSIFWNPETFTPSTKAYITISGGGDSFYEYLLKTHILMNGEENLQLNMWETSVESMIKYLRSVSKDGSVYLSEEHGGVKHFRSGELVCFMPGNLLLGSRYLQNDTYTTFAEELMDSCYKTWSRSPTGLSPEKWSWLDQQTEENSDANGFNELQKFTFKQIGFVPTDRSYQLRPETVESLFYFYRLTGDKKYQDMAWNVFESIERNCKTPSGYSSVRNIMDFSNPDLSDFQESYFFAETLKYLYLIFSDPNLISLDEYVFNTEAHPFKLKKPIKVQV